ncbi:MAG: hypothetical protein QNK66_00600 [Porticoccaceae bacterium]|jgi:hypothetical protein|tara:strand:- start:446 stop:817 length:372 start_codon:yes stop_codon:yes gene_type:complete
MFKLNAVALFCALPLLANCASSPDSIAAVPYPDQVFRNMTCDQIKAEYLKIEANVANITGQQSSERRKDQGLSLAGGMLLGSSLFLTEGNTETASELALIKGKYESVSRVSAEKKCATDVVAQ